MNRYAYQGPVMEFSRCVDDNWKAETMASSAAKAKNNLMYQWKKQNGRVAGCKITLPGKVKLIS